MSIQPDHSGLIDLHLHSTFSDGTLSPAELVERARLGGVGTISLTDHDSLDGIEEARIAGHEAGIQVVPGVEMSGYDRNREVHILGYFIDSEEAGLRSTLEQCVATRRDRMHEMISRLERRGVNLDAAEILSNVCSAGRPHLAKALIEGGHASSIRHVYQEFIGPTCEAYVPKLMISVEKVIDLIKNAGGLAILAHPARHHREARLLEFKSQGLDGLEVYHGTQPKGTTRWLRKMSIAHGFLMTGGSDFHGEAVRPSIQVAESILPQEEFATLHAAAVKRRQAPVQSNPS